uniref:Uncharacterized protein n=1 Tax=Odontella aurita TaxID=265563 RepID=A0A7S4K4D1_9STRA
MGGTETRAEGGSGGAGAGGGGDVQSSSVPRPTQAPPIQDNTPVSFGFRIWNDDGTVAESSGVSAASGAASTAAAMTIAAASMEAAVKEVAQAHQRQQQHQHRHKNHKRKSPRATSSDGGAKDQPSGVGVAAAGAGAATATALPAAPNPPTKPVDARLDALRRRHSSGLRGLSTQKEHLMMRHRLQRRQSCSDPDLLKLMSRDIIRARMEGAAFGGLLRGVGPAAKKPKPPSSKALSSPAEGGFDGGGSGKDPSDASGEGRGGLAVSSSRDRLRQLMSAPVIDWDKVRRTQRDHYESVSRENSLAFGSMRRIHSTGEGGFETRTKVSGLMATSIMRLDQAGGGNGGEKPGRNESWGSDLKKNRAASAMTLTSFGVASQQQQSKQGFAKNEGWDLTRGRLRRRNSPRGSASVSAARRGDPVVVAQAAVAQAQAASAAAQAAAKAAAVLGFKAPNTLIQPPHAAGTSGGGAGLAFPPPASAATSTNSHSHHHGQNHHHHHHHRGLVLKRGASGTAAGRDERGLAIVPRRRSPDSTSGRDYDRTTRGGEGADMASKPPGASSSQQPPRVAAHRAQELSGTRQLDAPHWRKGRDKGEVAQHQHQHQHGPHSASSYEQLSPPSLDPPHIPGALLSVHYPPMLEAGVDAEGNSSTQSGAPHSHHHGHHLNHTVPQVFARATCDVPRSSAADLFQSLLRQRDANHARGMSTLACHSAAARTVAEAQAHACAARGVGSKGAGGAGGISGKKSAMGGEPSSLSLSRPNILGGGGGAGASSAMSMTSMASMASAASMVSVTSVCSSGGSGSSTGSFGPRGQGLGLALMRNRSSEAEKGGSKGGSSRGINKRGSGHGLCLARRPKGAPSGVGGIVGMGSKDGGAKPKGSVMGVGAISFDSSLEKRSAAASSWQRAELGTVAAAALPRPKSEGAARGLPLSAARRSSGGAGAAMALPGATAAPAPSSSSDRAIAFAALGQVFASPPPRSAGSGADHRHHPSNGSYSGSSAAVSTSSLPLTSTVRGGSVNREYQRKTSGEKRKRQDSLVLRPSKSDPGPPAASAADVSQSSAAGNENHIRLK